MLSVLILVEEIRILHPQNMYLAVNASRCIGGLSIFTGSASFHVSSLLLT